MPWRNNFSRIMKDWELNCYKSKKMMNCKHYNNWFSDSYLTQSAAKNTFAIQNTLVFSNLCITKPSRFVSQYELHALCTPAPTFWAITTEHIILNGYLSFDNAVKMSSINFSVTLYTFNASYSYVPSLESTTSLTLFCTCCWIYENTISWVILVW